MLQQHPTAPTQHNNSRHWGRLLFPTIEIYGATLLVFIGLRAFIGERFILVALFNSVAHLLLLGAVGLLLLCLFMRRLRPAALLIPSALSFFLFYGGQLLPHTPPTLSEDHKQISLLTYNIFSEQIAAPSVEEIVRDSDVDVVLLQEISTEDAEYLAEALADIYPHQAIHTQTDAWGRGMSVFSRYPITGDRYWLIDRAHQRVTLDFDGETITLYNTRPLFPFSEGGFEGHAKEVLAVLEMAEQDSGPLILGGDFNMSDLSETYQEVTSQYIDSFRSAGTGLGFTFPAGAPDIDQIPIGIRRTLTLPLVRLDYIFHSDDFVTIDAQVWPTSGGSDHRPLRVELALIPQGQ